MGVVEDKISWHEKKLLKERSSLEWNKNKVQTAECRVKFHEDEIIRLKKWLESHETIK